MTIITPTIGRKVWFYEGDGSKEQDATVIDVHNDRLISVFVISRGGEQSVRHAVTLVQDGDETPVIRHAKWMPHQVGQAKATTPQATQPDSKA
jgi:hypothetical protein